MFSDQKKGVSFQGRESQPIIAADKPYDVYRDFDPVSLMSKRSAILAVVRDSLDRVFSAVPEISANAGRAYARVDWASRTDLRAPRSNEKFLVLNAAEFPPDPCPPHPSWPLARSRQRQQRESQPLPGLPSDQGTQGAPPD